MVDVVEMVTVSELNKVILVSKVDVSISVVVIVTVLSTLLVETGVVKEVMVMSVDTTTSMLRGGGAGFMQGKMTAGDLLQSMVLRPKPAASVVINTHLVFSVTYWKKLFVAQTG